MITVKILSDTAIGGEPVRAGEIVEVDEGTFRTLQRCKRCELVKGDVKAAKTEKPKFTKVEPKKE